MKKINLVLVGGNPTVYYGRVQGTNQIPRPMILTPQNTGAVEVKDGVTTLFTLDYLYGTSKEIITEVTSGTFNDYNLSKNLTSTKRDGVDYVCSFNVNAYNLLLAISSGSDPDAGTTLLYIKGRSLNNSKPYLVYEIASTFNEFLAL